MSFFLMLLLHHVLCCPAGYCPLISPACRPCRDAAWRWAKVSIWHFKLQIITSWSWFELQNVPIDVVIDWDIVAVVIVVRLPCLNLTVSSSNHNVAIIQKHLTHSVLHRQEHTPDEALFKQQLCLKANRKWVPPDHGGRTLVLPSARFWSWSWCRSYFWGWEHRSRIHPGSSDQRNELHERPSPAKTEHRTIRRWMWECMDRQAAEWMDGWIDG